VYPLLGDLIFLFKILKKAWNSYSIAPFFKILSEKINGIKAGAR
jgi:hypothetical protein